jgi:polar amino acid transport system substrate-binding protein
MSKTIKVILLLSFTLTMRYSFSCELKAGFDVSKPQHYFDEKGKVVGTDVEILKKLLSSTKCKVRFIELPWSRSLAMVESGSIDIAIGAKFTKERNQFAHFSAPYKTMQHALYTRKGFHDEVNSITSFLNNEKNTLGVMIGWGYPPEISKVINSINYKNKLTKLSHLNQLVKMLKLERVEGIIYSPVTMSTHKERALFKQRALYQEKLHFIFSRKTTTKAFVDQFNKDISKVEMIK